MDTPENDPDLRQENLELRRRLADLEGKVAELRDTEDRYRVLYESNPAMYFTLDREGTVRQVNAYGAAKLGYEPEELIGRPVTDVFHEDEREIVREQLRQCLESPEEVVDWELRKVHRSGRVMWVREAARTVTDTSGEPMVLVACADISELKSVQRQLEEIQEHLEERVELQTRELRDQHRSLEESERRYRSLVQTQSEMIVRWKPDGTRTFVNDAYCRYFERSREELIGTSFFPLVAEEDRARVRDKVHSLTPGRSWGLDVHRVLLPEGTEAWHEWSDRALFDDQGQLVELQSVGRDVTDRVRASEELAASEERYRLLAENISDVIVTLDLDFSISYASPSVRLLLGYLPEELCRLDLEEVITRDSLELASQLLSKELAASVRPGIDPLRSRTLDLELRAKDGAIVLCEAKASFLRNEDGSPHRILAVLRDITEWKKTQDALRRSERMLFRRQKLEAIGKLAGGLAHDFNNLLTVIYGNLELLALDAEAGQKPPVEHEEIRAAADRGAALIRQLLAFGRRQSMAPELLDLNALIESTVKMLPRLLREDIAIVSELEPDLGLVRGDAAQLEQVLVNLAVNARDAMPSGGSLTIRTRRVRARREDRQEEAIDWIELQVVDTGVGIPDEERDRIFEPFFTTKDTGKGTGLGLASVYGIVQQSGGTVSFESIEGEGTKFTVRLPAIDSETAEGEPGPESLAPSHGGGERILVVEDDPGLRLLVRKTLEKQGYQVLEASNGHEALSVAESRGREIDLVLSDLVMPGMNGVQMAEKLTTSNPGLKVLFMTGHPPDSISRLADLPNTEATIFKPFTPQGLAHRVAEALGRPAPGSGDPRDT